MLSANWYSRDDKRPICQHISQPRPTKRPNVGSLDINQLTIITQEYLAHIHEPPPPSLLSTPLPKSMHAFCSLSR